MSRRPESRKGFQVSTCFLRVQGPRDKYTAVDDATRRLLPAWDTSSISALFVSEPVTAMEVVFFLTLANDALPAPVSLEEISSGFVKQ